MYPIVRKILDEYNTLMDNLTDQQLLIDANSLDMQNYTVKEPTGDRVNKTILTWSGASGLSYLMHEHASIEQYTEIVKRRDFNFCLFDGSLIQIFYQMADNEIIKHRLCFVPCPFPYPQDEQFDIGLADIPELMSEIEMRREIRLCSPIRFDFDAAFCDDKHSHSHVTLNKSSCRLPAYGPVSLGHFVRFIFRYFYEEQFEESKWWHELPPKIYSKTLVNPVLHEFHIQTAVDD